MRDEEASDIRGLAEGMVMHRWDPSTYMKSSSPQKRWAEELISKIPIRGDERVLDIGCGDGKITAWISRLVPRGSVVGLDSSREMISFARSQFPAEEWPNLHFQQGDARDLHVGMVRLEVEAWKGMEAGAESSDQA